MATANNDGVDIHYEVTGGGPPVVLLHGFPDSSRLWRHQVPALADAGFRVIVPDMRGYGGSAKPTDVDAYNILHLVADVGAVLTDAGATQSHVVGHDWGAAVAWALASVAPDAVDRLAVLSVGHPSTFRGAAGSWTLTSSRSRGICCSSNSPGWPRNGSRQTTGPISAAGGAIPIQTRWSSSWRRTPR